MNIDWLVFVALMLSLAQAALYRRYSLRRVEYERRFDRETAYVGEAVELVETVTNYGWLPLPWVRLEAVFATGLHFAGKTETQIMRGQAFQYHKSVFSLGPRMRVRRHHALVAARRGYHTLQPVAMTAGDLFGMAHGVKDWRVRSELFVFPRLLPLAELPVPARSLLGELAVRRFIHPDPFLTAGVRAYRAGDPLRAVHWTATARTGELQVRREEYTADFRVMVLVNFECFADMWEDVTDPEMIEAALVQAASLAALIAGRGLAASFAANGVLAGDEGEEARIEPGTGPDHLERLLRTVARLTMVVRRSFVRLLTDEVERGVRGMDIVLFTAFVSEPMERCIERLRALGNSVNVVLLAPSAAPERGVAPVPLDAEVLEVNPGA